MRPIRDLVACICRYRLWSSCVRFQYILFSMTRVRVQGSSSKSKLSKTEMHLNLFLIHVAETAGGFSLSLRKNTKSSGSHFRCGTQLGAFFFFFSIKKSSISDIHVTSIQTFFHFFFQPGRQLSLRLLVTIFFPSSNLLATFCWDRNKFWGVTPKSSLPPTSPWSVFSPNKKYAPQGPGSMIREPPICAPQFPQPDILSICTSKKSTKNLDDKIEKGKPCSTFHLIPKVPSLTNMFPPQKIIIQKISSPEKKKAQYTDLWREKKTFLNKEKVAKNPDGGNLFRGKTCHPPLVPIL